MEFFEAFEEINNFGVENLHPTIATIFFIIIAIIVIIVLIISIVLYVFTGLSLSELAKKNEVENAWLAWLPVGNMYLLGKIGFEIYAPVEKRNSNFTWVLLACSLASWVLYDSGLSSMAMVGVTVFSTWAYYYIFKKINEKNCVLFTILSAMFDIGPVLLFVNKKRFTNEKNNIDMVEQEEKEEKTKKEEHSKFCTSCGNKLNKTSKFCPKCGNKIK